MVLQIAGAVILPIVMLIVAASPFDEQIQVQPSNPPPAEVDSNNYVVFFILWFFWLLILSGIVYRMGKRRFGIKKEYDS